MGLRWWEWLVVWLVGSITVAVPIGWRLEKIAKDYPEASPEPDKETPSE